MKELLKLLGVFLANTGVATFVVARFSQPEQGMTILLTILGVLTIHLIEARTRNPQANKFSWRPFRTAPIHSRYPKMSEADISRVREKLVQGRQSAYKRSA
jgi:cytochrome c biogenesis factor